MDFIVVGGFLLNLCKAMLYWAFGSSQFSVLSMWNAASLHSSSLSKYLLNVGLCQVLVSLQGGNACQGWMLLCCKLAGCRGTYLMQSFTNGLFHCKTVLLRTGCLLHCMLVLLKVPAQQRAFTEYVLLQSSSLFQGWILLCYCLVVYYYLLVAKLLPKVLHCRVTVLF